MKLRLAILSFFLFFAWGKTVCAQSSSNENNTLLWKVSGNGLSSPSYLFGTFHLMCKDDIQFSSALQQAFTNSKFIYMEMDFNDPENTLGMMSYVNMKDGKTLSALYTKEEYERVARFFKDSLHASLDYFNRMKPNFIEAMLYPKLMPCKRISGVEEELRKMAADHQIPIKGLENMAFQSSVFDRIPYEDQAKELLNSIDSIDTYRQNFLHLLEIYKNQRVEEMEKAMVEEPSFNATKELLLDGRNRNWVAQLNGIMKKDGVFVAIGAGHLVGAQGLIALLRKEGYWVTPVAN